MDSGTSLADQPSGLDEVHRVAVVLLDPSRDRENVRVKDDVPRRKVGLLGQQLECPGADVDFTLDGVRLPDFVEGHHDNAKAEASNRARLFEKRLFAFLE